jgi:hypothetical protein
MDDKRRLLVAKLAQAESRARQHFESLGMVNVHGRTAQEREDLDTEYAVARANWTEALYELLAVVEPGPVAIEALKKLGREYVPMRF